MWLGWAALAKVKQLFMVRVLIMPVNLNLPPPSLLFLSFLLPAAPPARNRHPPLICEFDPRPPRDPWTNEGLVDMKHGGQSLSSASDPGLVEHQSHQAGTLQLSPLPFKQQQNKHTRPHTHAWLDMSGCLM